MPFKALSWSQTAALIFVLLCAATSTRSEPSSHIYGADKFSKGPAPAWVTPVAIPASKPSPEPTTIRLADKQLRWDQQGGTIYSRRVVQANNNGGLKQLGQLQIEFNPAFQTMTLHSLKIQRQNKTIDKLASVRIRFLERELELEQSIYDGRVTVSLLVDDVRVGDTLDMAYSIQGSNPVFNGRIAQDHAWEVEAPVLLRRLSVLTPADRRFSWRFIGASRIATSVKPIENKRDGLRELVLQQRDLTPFRVEENYPRGFQPSTWLQISEYQSWNQVARWATDLFRIAPPSGAEYKALVERLRTIADPAKRAVTALEFVQSEIRYTSVSFGENSHRPATPDEVLVRRYGDCKDKALLLVSLYQALGLKARPTLVGVGSYNGLSEWLPGPTPFDHVIVKLDLEGNTYWLDATAQQKPRNLATLGRLHDGADVLVVDAATQSLQTIERGATPQYNVREKVRLDRFDGPAILERSTTFTGRLAENQRTVMAQTAIEEIKKEQLNYVQYSYIEPERIGDLKINDDPERNSITYTSTYRIKNYAEKDSDGWLMYHKPTYINSFFNVPETGGRNSPHAVSYPINTVYSHEVELPKGISLASSEKKLTISNPAFTLTQARQRGGRNARVEYTLATLAPAVAPAQMAAYIKDIRRVQDEVHTNIFISDESIAPQTNQPSLLTSLDNNNGQQTAAANNGGRTTATAEQKTLDAYRKSAEQGFAQGQYDLAMMYLDARGVARDTHEAFHWLNQAGAQGHAQAQYVLASLYEQGDGVKRDHKQALIWYLRAAEQGMPEAQHRLGTLYERGLGTNPNREQAQLWYERAAAAQYVKGQYNLGLLRADLGFYYEAYCWLTLAERKGAKEARNARTRVAQRLSTQEILKADASVQAWNPKAFAPRLIPPRIYRDAQPVYSDEARQYRGEGKVTLSLSVDTNGKVLAALLLSRSGSLALDSVAEETASRYLFSPAQQNNKAVAGQYTLTLKLRPGDKDR